MAGTIVANTLNTDTGLFSTNNAYLGIAKAWVNFNGSTAAINGSFNVGSITKNGTGDYTINFTTAMANANYSVSGTSTDTGATYLMQISPALVATPLTTASARVQTRASSTGAIYDVALNSIAIFSS
jgi:hypothetical protein